MSTRSWSFIAAGVLTLFALMGFALGYWLNRPSTRKKDQKSEDELPPIE